MADIVFGVGTSHSPMLATKPEQWHLRAQEDHIWPPQHYFRGELYTMEQLEKMMAGRNLANNIKPDVQKAQDATNQKHLATLAEKIKAANLDVLVIFGDDQHEVLHSDNMPAFMVFNGKDIPFYASTPEQLAKMPEGVRVAQWANEPAKDMTLPGAADLGTHVVQSVVSDGFDVSVSDKFSDRKDMDNSIGHAFGFYYHRLMNDLKDYPKLTTLPIFINTFWAPNQPPAKRVYEFGRSVGRAIRAWPTKARVGIAASGGFSHFVIDEELDRRLLKALEDGDVATLVNTPEGSLQHGNSEIKNWIAALGAMETTGLKFKTLDYVPCYRSLSGTGNAMAFGLWQA